VAYASTSALGTAGSLVLVNWAIDPEPIGKGKFLVAPLSSVFPDRGMSPNGLTGI
jgi:hypothetical protein